ncbi:Hypoxic response protein 1 [compost metagenome]
MQVRDIMKKGAKVINHKHSVEEAARMMAQGDYGSLPVEKDDKMIGMLTDRDIAVRVVAQGKDARSTKVEECMSEGITYCYEDDDIQVVSQKMREKKQRRLPVVNKEKRLVGMVSLSEVSNNVNDARVTQDIMSKVTH